jgi:hypothetical protein
MKSSERIRNLKKQGKELASHPLDKLNWEDMKPAEHIPGIEGLALEFAEWALQITHEHIPKLAPSSSAFLDWREGKSTHAIALAFLNREPVIEELRAVYLGPAADLFN